MIEIRHDKRRGCGFRKAGGLYLTCPAIGAGCGKLPIPLTVCPTCNAGIKPSRGYTWVEADRLTALRACGFDTNYCLRCPLASNALGRAGLLWIGEKYYRRPEDWSREANEQGVSRRVPHVPKGFILGRTWVLVAHRKAIQQGCTLCQGNGHAVEPKPTEVCPECNGEGYTWTAAIFHAFRPTAVEYVVKGDESEEQLEAMRKRGITPVRILPESTEPQAALPFFRL